MKSSPKVGVTHLNGWLGLVCGLFFLLTIAPAPARAHKVTVFAWVEGDTVITQSKFAGGRSAKGARLEVYNRDGQKLLEGLSDDQGQFAFKAPLPEDLQIVLIAGAGHRAEWRVRADEFTPAAAVAPSAAVEDGARPSSPPAPAVKHSPETVTLTRDELQLLVESAVERKLAPILRRLEQQGDGPTLSDVVGGIGYILGLVGLGAYMHSRRRNG